ncbi:hypothetical protein ACOME3_009315 [Neoechinorhynchus agilis]
MDFIEYYYNLYDVRSSFGKKISVGFSDGSEEDYLTSEEDELVKIDRSLQKAESKDFVKFGLIPEFIGRLPVTVPFHHLNEEMLRRILKEPQNALIKQYQTLFSMDNCDFSISDSAMSIVCREARDRRMGARSLRSILERELLDAMYDTPGGDISKVELYASDDDITKRYLKVRMIRRIQEDLSDSEVARV